jgi:hypothetical protein
MHPIERLRYVARASGIDHATVARETAGALAGLGFDHAGIVTACRRVVERHPASGPVWWLTSTVLCAPDPIAAAWRCADALDADPTADQLSYAFPDDARITVLGWPLVTVEALPRRGDLEVLVVDVLDEGRPLVRALERADVAAEMIAPHGLGRAAASSDVVVVEASAIGPDGFVAVAGSRAAAAVAKHAGVAVWLVGGVGRMLPGPTWKALVERLALGDDEADEIVPLDLVDWVAGPNGVVALADAVAEGMCPVAPELLRPIAF